MTGYPGKFSVLDESGDHLPHDYGDRFFREPCTGGIDRLVIGPSENPVDLLLHLASSLTDGEWGILYVLLLSRRGENRTGRYQSPILPGLEAVEAILSEYRTFLEGDGRHHLWLNCFADETLFVYDQHEVLFAYGCLDDLANRLRRRGFKEEKFWFPSPHSHHYQVQYDEHENRLVSELAGGWSPLCEQDSWS